MKAYKREMVVGIALGGLIAAALLLSGFSGWFAQDAAAEDEVIMLAGYDEPLMTDFSEDSILSVDGQRTFVEKMLISHELWETLQGEATSTLYDLEGNISQQSLTMLRIINGEQAWSSQSTLPDQTLTYAKYINGHEMVEVDYLNQQYTSWEQGDENTFQYVLLELPRSIAEVDAFNDGQDNIPIFEFHPWEGALPYSTMVYSVSLVQRRGIFNFRQQSSFLEREVWVIDWVRLEADQKETMRVDIETGIIMKRVVYQSIETDAVQGVHEYTNIT